MMSNLLVLPNRHQVFCPFVFSVLPGCFKKLQNAENIRDAKQYLCDCFDSDHYLFSSFESRKSGDVNLRIYIENGVFSCKPSDDKRSFLLYDYYPCKPQDVTASIQEGINIVSYDGTLLNITLKDPEDIDEHYFRGWSIDLSESKKYRTDTYSIIALVESESEKLKNKRRQYFWSKPIPSDDTESSDRVSEFEEYLSLAENYALFEDEEARKLAQQIKSIICYNPKAADYRRIDRVAYTFDIDDSFDYQNYKINSKVELHLSNEHVATATIINITNKTITLLFDEVIDYKALPKMILVSLSYSDIMYETQIDALDELRSDKLFPVNLDNCIGRFKPLDFQVPEKDAISSKYFAKLNTSQREAAYKGVSFKDVLLVQGPAGTGKTTVIADLIEYYCIEKGCRVLVSSQNNKAVDNVLEKVVTNREINAIRAGSESKVSETIYPFLLENRLSQFRNSIIETITSNEKSLNSMNGKYIILLPKLRNAQRLIEELIIYKEQYDLLLTELKNSLYRITQSYLYTNSDNEKLIQSQLDRINRLCSIRDNGLKLKVVQTIVNYQIKRELYLYRTYYLRLTDNHKDYKNSVVEHVNRYVRTDLYNLSKNIKKTRMDLVSELKNLCISLPSERADFNLLCNDIMEEKLNIKTLEQLHNELKMIDEEADITQKKLDLIKSWMKIVSNQNNYALSDALLESVNLVGATCIGISSQKKFRHTYYDIAIIDEAAQIQIQNILVPMSRAKKSILFGDHKQLPPIAKKEIIDKCNQEGIETDLIESSLFEKLFDEFPETNKVLLNTQYRMPEEISNLLSQWFYCGEVITNKPKCSSILPDLFNSPFVILDTSHMKNRHELPKTEYANMCEAELIKLIITYIYNDEDFLISPDNIGVIAPYADQVKLIKSRILNCIDFPAIDSVVNTVDSFQGQERDLIIYSCTRSNHYRYDSPGRIGFLAELRRLNVAMSRAREMLIFIGDFDFLRKCTGEQTKFFSQFITEMYKYAKNGNAQIVSAEKIISSLAGDS